MCTSCVYADDMETEIESVEEELLAQLFSDKDIPSRSIQYTDEGAYVIDSNGTKLSDTYKMIFEDKYADYKICRFISENGLIGYLSKETGKVVVEPKFVEATKMSSGAAVVSENKTEGYYYISCSGKRLNKGYFRAAQPFSETQGYAARVQLADGSWGIINKKGDFLVKDLLSVNILPSIKAIGSGIRDNGNVIVFKLPVEENQEYEQFDDISEVWYGEFAKVRDKKTKLYGVVCGWNGDIIVQPRYVSIDWERVPMDTVEYSNMTIFIGHKSDGTCDVITWDPGSSERG